MDKASRFLEAAKSLNSSKDRLDYIKKASTEAFKAIDVSFDSKQNIFKIEVPVEKTYSKDMISKFEKTTRASFEGFGYTRSKLIIAFS